MVDQISTRTWLMRGLYFVLAAGIVFIHLLPIEAASGRYFTPDWLMALTFAWAMRRPEYVPTLSIALVMLYADLLFQRPPGLNAALIVVGAEVLRARAAGNRNMPFLLEWMSAAGVMIGVGIAYRVMLALFFIPTPALSLVLIQLAISIAVYPIVVFGSHWLLGVRRPAPGEVDVLGHRL